MSSGFSLLGSSEEEGVGSGRRLHDELIESHASTTSSDDSGTGGLGESKSGNVKLGHIEGSVIIGDNSDNDGSAAGIFTEASDHAGDGYWGSVNSGGNESSEDGLAETGLGSSAQEGEELQEKRNQKKGLITYLDEEVLVEIVASGAGLVSLLDSSTFDQIDTLKQSYKLSSWKIIIRRMHGTLAKNYCHLGGGFIPWGAFDGLKHLPYL